MAKKSKKVKVRKTWDMFTERTITQKFVPSKKLYKRKHHSALEIEKYFGVE